jgi:hypothetical protein
MKVTLSGESPQVSYASESNTNVLIKENESDNTASNQVQVQEGQDNTHQLSQDFIKHLIQNLYSS